MNKILKLPHSGDMVLINKILSYGDDYVEVSADISADNAFLEADKFYTYKAVEMMAQSLGAFLGLHKKDGFTMGFLLGVREFEIFKDHLKVGDSVRIRSKISLQDDSGFSVCNCELFLKDELIASAILSVLSPDEKKFLEIKDA